MILQHLNYIAVLVCGVIYFAIGGLWFSPVLFSKAWMAGHNIAMPTNDAEKEAFRKMMPMQMLTTFVVCLVATTAVDCLVVLIDTHSWMVGIKIGILASVFASATIALSHMYTRKSFKITMIDAGYHIVGLIVVGAILAVWR